MCAVIYFHSAARWKVAFCSPGGGVYSGRFQVWHKSLNHGSACKCSAHSREPGALAFQGAFGLESPGSWVVAGVKLCLFLRDSRGFFCISHICAGTQYVSCRDSMSFESSCWLTWRPGRGEDSIADLVPISLGLNRKMGSREQATP